MAGVADSSYCSLPMSKFSSSSTPEKVTFNLRPCSFVEMVGVYVGCVKYFPTCSFARSFQDNKKYKNLIIAASSSQQTVHVQGDNQVSLEFKRLSRVGEVNAALQVMDKMEKNRVFLGSVDIVELLKCCIDLKLLEAGKRFMSMFCGLSQNPVRLCLINWWRCTVDWPKMAKEKIFVQMKEAGVRPNGSTFDGVIEACMVDLLGRSQKIAEAKEITENMPIEPSSVVRETLEKYTKSGPTERPGELGSFVSPSGLRLSNKKKVKGKSNFKPDEGESREKQGLRKVEVVGKEVREAGYVPDTKYVLHDRSRLRSKREGIDVSQ
ncbi:pentatricopeptide repeat-containing protein At5g50990-like [Mangifera indica]|uniref:pentatricopeptide repeat-containing protein At5g50990-like n=1 Tax=Mangifera indica TaxID=29780 RepID=UPI001CFAF49D|nr:pentatricopeptide repeat-containing protein At5g50990-like [Mangifera indica]